MIKIIITSCCLVIITFLSTSCCGTASWINELPLIQEYLYAVGSCPETLEGGIEKQKDKAMQSALENLATRKSFTIENTTLSYDSSNGAAVQSFFDTVTKTTTEKTLFNVELVNQFYDKCGKYGKEKTFYVLVRTEKGNQ